MPEPRKEKCKACLQAKVSLEVAGFNLSLLLLTLPKAENPVWYTFGL